MELFSIRMHLTTIAQKLDWTKIKTKKNNLAFGEMGSAIVV